MKKIAVELSQGRELSLLEFLAAGDSFRICCEAHLWPPLDTFNAFLDCGSDDAGAGGTLRWSPFRLTEAEYIEAVAEADPEGTVDALGTDHGDWKRWFDAAVARLRSN